MSSPKRFKIKKIIHWWFWIHSQWWILSSVRIQNFKVLRSYEALSFSCCIHFYHILLDSIWNKNGLLDKKKNDAYDIDGKKENKINHCWFLWEKHKEKAPTINGLLLNDIKMMQSGCSPFNEDKDTWMNWVAHRETVWHSPNLLNQAFRLLVSAFSR